MSPLAEAAARRPFANGSEGGAWMAAWCDHCTRDHGLHNGGESQPMCGLIGSTMFGDDWPEGWLPEPDDGRFFMPSRIVCIAFEPCEQCGGDPGAEERAERVAEVTAYWRGRKETT